MKPLKLQFQVGQAKISKDDKEVLGWAMALIGLFEDVRHEIRSAILPNYPTRSQMSRFFGRTTRQMQEWFESAEYNEATLRATEKRRGGLIIIPGRG